MAETQKENILDYLHYYVNSEVRITSITADIDNKLNRGIMNINGVLTSKLLSNLYKYSNIVTNIRQLDTITDEECLELCKHCNETTWGDYRFNKWYVERNTPNQSKDWKTIEVKRVDGSDYFQIDLLDGEVHIYYDEPLWDKKKYDECADPIPNYRFWYLKKGFDIFELKEKGLI